MCIILRDILGCNVLSRSTTVCIRWQYPMIQSNCDVHSIKHYYITSLSICHMFTESRSHCRLYCPEQKHNCVHSRLAFTHLHRFVQAFLQPHFKRVVQHRVHEESSSNPMNLAVELLALQWVTVPRCALPDKQQFSRAVQDHAMLEECFPSYSSARTTASWLHSHGWVLMFVDT